MGYRGSRRVSADELGISGWKFPDEGALSAGPIRNGYVSRKKAISLYLQGATEEAIKAESGIGLSQIRRLIRERCLSVHEDGEVWGWRGLIPNIHINPYQRKHKIVVDQFGMGAVGALTVVWNTHPDLREKFNRRILTAASQCNLSAVSRSKQDHWRWFLDQLRVLGYEVNEKWPFNTKTLGYNSICRYIEKVYSENPVLAAATIGGLDHKKKLLTGDGTNRPVQHLFERVEMDAHKIDGRFSVLIPHPTGGYTQKIVHRLWVVVILEIVSRCVLGYHLSMRKEVSKTDVLRAIKSALTQWKRPFISFGDHAYLPEANLPSSTSEKFIGVCWDQTSVDGALAETCQHVRSVLRNVVGSELLEPRTSFSARRSKDDRPFIESFFRQIGVYGFQKLSNSTGGKPKDKGGRNPDEIALTSRFQLEYASELLAVLIANYNAEPHSSLGGRSPLEYLQFRAMYPSRELRYADPNSVNDLVSFRKLCIVKGGYKEGRRPYVNFYHGRYTNDTLSQRHDLVGNEIWVINHIADDSRLLRASTTSGHSLGLLHVGVPWNKLPHSLEVRTAVASLVQTGKLRVGAGYDAVEVFMNYHEQQSSGKLPVHPAYLEARRIITEVVEGTLGRSFREIQNEADDHSTNEDSTKFISRAKTTQRSENSSDTQRILPARRKTAND